MKGQREYTAVLLTICIAAFCFTAPVTLATAQTVNPTNVGAQTTPPSSPVNILWNTTIPWNLADSPASSLTQEQILGKDRIWTKPVIADGVVYAGLTSIVHYGRYNGPEIRWVNIYAFDAKSGRQLWSYQANFYEVTSIAFSEARVCFGLRSGFIEYADSVSGLYALDASSGDLLWKTPCTIFYSTPVAQDGKIFLNSYHSLLAFDNTDGSILWNYTTNDFIGNAPVVSNNIVYVSSNDHTFYALKSEDGTKAWSITNDMGFSEATVADGVLYLPSDDGNIYTLNAETGAKLRSYHTTSPDFNWANYTSHSTPIYHDGVLYFSSHSGQHIHIQKDGQPDFCYMADRYSVLALDAGNANQLWNFTVDTDLSGSPVLVVDGTVFADSIRGILGYDAGTGALVWNYTNGGSYAQTPPVMGNGVLYLGFGDGQICALETPNVEHSNVTEVSSQAVDLTPLAVVVFALSATQSPGCFSTEANV